jgi:hypothetical protein
LLRGTQMNATSYQKPGQQQRKIKARFLDHVSACLGPRRSVELSGTLCA